MAEEGDRDSNWVPPSEAEIKVLQAKRERSDKVSRIMADYLLRGYKMLNSVCDRCETVLLQDRHQKTYCVACSEVDNEHTKDNPALSGVAAQRQMEESQFARSGDVPINNSLFSNAANEALSAMETASTDEVNRSRLNEEESVLSCIQAVQEKMVWASKKLTKANSSEASLQWCSLLKACAETLVALRNVQVVEGPFRNNSC